MKVVFFKSRNKDNKNIYGFKERTKLFFAQEWNDYCQKKFADFVNNGICGELCRAYISCNERDLEKTRKALICRLVNDDSFDPRTIESTAISIAMKHENAATKHWLFDFDCDDRDKLEEFIKDIRLEFTDGWLEIHETVHGYGVVVQHGFDTRKLMDKWHDIVDLKRDDMVLVKWFQELEF